MGEGGREAILFSLKINESHYNLLTRQRESEGEYSTVHTSGVELWNDGGRGQPSLACQTFFFLGGGKKKGLVTIARFSWLTTECCRAHKLNH